MLNRQYLLQNAKNRFSKVIMVFFKYKKMLGLKPPMFTDYLLSIPAKESVALEDDFRRLDVKPRDIF